VHLRNIFTKICVNTRTEAALYAMQIGLVKSPAPSDQEINPPDQGIDLLPPSQTTTVEIPPRSIPSVRQVILITILIIVVITIGAGILLTRKQPILSTSPSQVVPTPESRWTVLDNMPTARAGLAVTVYENQVYAIGGETSQGVTGVVELYDPSTGSWLELTQKPVPVTDVKAGVIGGRIYVPGGRVASGDVTNILEVYDPRLDRWEKSTPLPAALSAYALAVFEGKMYLIGGWDGEHFLASVYEYNADVDTWRTLSPMPTARAFAGAAVAGGSIFVLGGFDGKEALSSNEEYLPTEDSWSPRATLPAGRYALGVTSIADIIYVVGGLGETGSTLTSLQYYDSQDQWQSFEDPFPGQWSYLGLVPLQTQIYGIGGQQDGNFIGQARSYKAIYTILIPAMP
jgi:N-acetylneuraminic acid mutarotase